MLSRNQVQRLIHGQKRAHTRTKSELSQSVSLRQRAGHDFVKQTNKNKKNAGRSKKGTVHTFTIVTLMAKTNSP